MFEKVIQKAEFLLKLNVPEAFLVKDKSEEKVAMNFIKESIFRGMSTSGTVKNELNNKMKQWTAKMSEKGAVKSFADKKKEVFDSSVNSILAYLQAPFELKKI